MILCGNLIISFLVNCVNPFFIVRHEISDRRSKIRERHILVKYSYKRDNRKRSRPPVRALYRARTRLVRLRPKKGDEKPMNEHKYICRPPRAPAAPFGVLVGRCAYAQKGLLPPAPLPAFGAGGQKRLRRIETLRYTERNPLTYRPLDSCKGYEDFGKIFSTPSGQP